MLMNKPLLYKCEVILGRIKENREKHVSTYQEAITGYRNKRAELLTKLQELAATQLLIPNETRDVKKQLEEIKQALREITGLVRPENHVEDYDQVIDQIENTALPEIELDAQSFAQYMRDDWAWKKAFVATSSSYGAGR